MMQRTEEMVKERLHDIRKTVEEAAAISGRSSDDVSVMAVTKTVPPVLVNAAIAEGITLLGENRAQELLEKYNARNCARLVMEAAEVYEKRGILL